MNWPDKIKKNGVLVRYKDEDIVMRISENHLKKVVNKISTDASLNHCHKEAENILQPVRSWAPWVILGGAAVAVLAVKNFCFKA